MLAAASAVVVLAALAGGLVAMGWLDGDEVALSETALEVFDSPAAEQPYGEGGEGDDAPGGDSPGLAEEDADVSPAAPAEVARNGAETSRPTGPPSEEESPPAAPDSGTAERELRGEAPPPDWRLTRARTLMDAGYITHPPEDNAVAYLERLLAADPGNPRAMAMLDEASTRLIEAAVRAHDQGLDYEARNTLEEVFGFDPADERAHRLWQEWVGAER